MIDKFKQAFEEEARELIAELEAALLELDQHREDTEVVGRAFRALHTIKGSGAMFGFDNVAAFAHHLENAFDQLRQGQLAVTTDLIRLALAAGDQTKTMLEEAAGGGTADPVRSEEILESLRQLTGESKLPAGAAGNEPAQTALPASELPGPLQEWRIRFRPPPDVLLQGTNPLLLLSELRQLGELQVRVDTSAVPMLNDLDPERCYLAWDLLLTTAAAREAIRDVFIFVEDSSELVIEIQSSQPEPRPCGPPARTVSSGAERSKDSTAASRAGTSLRVDAEKLDQLVNLVGELVTVQARLSEAAARLNDGDLIEVAEAVERL
jgi:two-component system chemotaxis sensor kinase CheA